MEFVHCPEAEGEHKVTQPTTKIQYMEMMAEEEESKRLSRVQFQSRMPSHFFGVCLFTHALARTAAAFPVRSVPFVAGPAGAPKMSNSSGGAFFFQPPLPSYRRGYDGGR